MSFAGYPTCFIYDRLPPADPSEPKQQKVQQLLWGDYVKETGQRTDGWVTVHGRGEDGYMRIDDLQADRLLEVNFVDVGQGDGAMIVTPDDEFLLVDAGKADNMWWFLRWRFNLRNHPDQVIHFRHAVITHPDADHYEGFRPLFSSPQLTFRQVWHNGIVERKGGKLGPVSGSGRNAVLTDVPTTTNELSALVHSPSVGGGFYSSLMRTALDSGRVDDILMASTELGFLPDFGPTDRVQLEVLGPAPTMAGGKVQLQRLGDPGQTKNGHSIVLKLRYRSVRILLGGDLNSLAEEHLTRHHARDATTPDEVTAAMRVAFGVDIAKTCHHGSADFVDDFLGYQEPAAWVISSGDNESYSHPRPETLGALGRHGRGPRPLIYSTELARSADEFVTRPEQILLAHNQSIRDAADTVRRDGSSPEEKPGKPAARLQRAIAVYGLITLRTDGTNVIIATKLERCSGNGQEFDYCILEPDQDGVLHLASDAKNDG